MRRVLVIAGVVFCVVLLYFEWRYDIRFNDDGHDLRLQRRSDGLGYSIEYPGRDYLVEIWEFGRTVHGGLAERRMFPDDLQRR